MPPPVPDLVDMAGARVLITDDVADTGATLRLVRDFCEGRVGDVRCAVVYEKPRSGVACEDVWRRTDRWINFPWSTLPPGVARPGAARGAWPGWIVTKGLLSRQAGFRQVRLMSRQ